MHGTIMVLDHEPNDFLSEDSVYESGFIPWIGDYCDDDVKNQDELIDEWVTYLEAKYPKLIERNGNSICFKKGFKAAYATILISDIQQYL